MPVRARQSPTFVPPLLAVLLLLGGACTQSQNEATAMEPTAAAAEGTPAAANTAGPYYYVSLNPYGARVEAAVNDLSIYRANVPNGGTFNSPVNVNLIGENNKLRVSLEPTKKGSTLTTLDEAELTGTVKRYEKKGQLAGPESGTLIAEFSLEKQVEKRKKKLEKQFTEKLKATENAHAKAELAEKEAEMTTPELPFEFTVEFDSPGAPSFRERLKEAPVIEDTSRVKDYAMKLRRLMKEQNTEALWQEFKPKFEDYQRGYYEQNEDKHKFFEEKVMNAYYESGLITEFSRADVKPERRAGGRVWELHIEPQDSALVKRYHHPDRKRQTFFSSKVKDGYFRHMKVLVGEVDGELKVIR